MDSIRASSTNSSNREPICMGASGSWGAAGAQRIRIVPTIAVFIFAPHLSVVPVRVCSNALEMCSGLNNKLLSDVTPACSPGRWISSTS